VGNMQKGVIHAMQYAICNINHIAVLCMVDAAGRKRQMVSGTIKNSF
jgi:hypothetical protein